jgi:predicted NAD/FAD-dependent oxidoreductase
MLCRVPVSASHRAVSHVAVLGAGLAGAACARALAQAGHAVHVFDKSRGPGGRLATRQLEWMDASGQAWATRLDHGAPFITARSAAFRAFVAQGVRDGGLAEWTPVRAAGSPPCSDGDRLHVPVPDMPALCRSLLGGVAGSWSVAVSGLHKNLNPSQNHGQNHIQNHGRPGWQLQAADARLDTSFDAVVLALPPAQAAPLLGPHRPDWARHASVVPMQPCWTLMGVARDTEPAPGWDVARPETGLLASVMRNDSRPGRARVPGQAHWVAHARAGWSRRHLEQPEAWVREQMQAALAGLLGQPVVWHHCVVHRWRYALPHAAAAQPSCWWDAAQGLGVCGDFLGGPGAEGAWLSAQALCAAMWPPAAATAEPVTPRAAVEAAHSAARRLVA